MEDVSIIAGAINTLVMNGLISNVSRKDAVAKVSIQNKESRAVPVLLNVLMADVEKVAELKMVVDRSIPVCRAAKNQAIVDQIISASAIDKVARCALQS